MALQNRTKYLFARKLKEMMEEMPFSDIKVSDLCERAGTSKQVFYYHFHDKYELAAWILQDDTPWLERDKKSFVQMAVSQYAYYWDNRDFHRNLFLDPGQYNMLRYQVDFTADLWTAMLCNYRSVKTLPPEDERWIRYHSYGMVNLLRDWILGTVQMTPEEFAQFQYDRYNEEQKRALDEYWFGTRKK